MNNLKWIQCSLKESSLSVPQLHSRTAPRLQTRVQKPCGTSRSVRMVSFCSLLFCLLLPAKGLEILDPEQVEYIHVHVVAPVGAAVTLDCGSTLPTVFIWGFTKPGTATNIALAYNYGQGPKLQSQSGMFGRMQVAANASALVVEELERNATGMYTCQALYGTDEGARVTFYFTRLDVEDD